MAVHAFQEGAATPARKALLLWLRLDIRHTACTQSPAKLVGRLCCCSSLQILLPSTSHCPADSHTHKT